MSAEHPWLGVLQESSAVGWWPSSKECHSTSTEHRLVLRKHDWSNNTNQLATDVSSCASVWVGRRNGYTTKRVDPPSRPLRQKDRFPQYSSSSSKASLRLLQLLLQLSDRLLVTRNCGDRRKRTNPFTNDARDGRFNMALSL